MRRVRRKSFAWSIAVGLVAGTLSVSCGGDEAEDLFGGGTAAKGGVGGSGASKGGTAGSKAGSGGSGTSGSGPVGGTGGVGGGSGGAGGGDSDAAAGTAGEAGVDEDGGGGTSGTDGGGAGGATDGGGTAGTGDDGGAGTTGSGGVTTGDASVGIGSPTPGAVACASSPCTVPSNMCCVSSGFPFQSSCVATSTGCLTLGAPVRCDDTPDCPQGQRCCGSPNALSAQSRCQEQCTGQLTVTLCRQTSECSGGLTCQRLQAPFAAYGSCR